MGGRPGLSDWSGSYCERGEGGGKGPLMQWKNWDLVLLHHGTEIHPAIWAETNWIHYPPAVFRFIMSIIMGNDWPAKPSHYLEGNPRVHVQFQTMSWTRFHGSSGDQPCIGWNWLFRSPPIGVLPRNRCLHLVWVTTRVQIELEFWSIMKKTRSYAALNSRIDKHRIKMPTNASL